ncbi:hypothetical protein [Sedimentibacter sp.]|uniref:hypothetical protein n=1 Tax=Sedimentibacter sp. TaxID=1960295 RepID=UPI0028A5A989|nr:hypothetical protein [Sedimentibacter sp.]
MKKIIKLINDEEIEEEVQEENFNSVRKDELGITSIEAGMWQYYVLNTRMYKGIFLFKKTTNPNLVEIYFNARHLLNEQGSHFFNILPEECIPNEHRTALGFVTYKTGDVSETVLQYLNVSVDGEVGIPGKPGAVITNFVFYAIYNIA